MADDETNDDKLDYAEIGELIFNAYETILSRKKTIKTPFKPSISTIIPERSILLDFLSTPNFSILPLFDKAIPL